MVIGIFIDPCYTPPQKTCAGQGAPAAQPVKPPAKDWMDFSAERNWEEAILAFLREHRREHFLLFRVVYLIVAESRQPTREEARRATVEVLETMMRLRKQRRIFRYRRRWISFIDHGAPIYPISWAGRIPSAGL